MLSDNPHMTAIVRVTLTLSLDIGPAPKDMTILALYEKARREGNSLVQEIEKSLSEKNVKIISSNLNPEVICG